MASAPTCGQQALALVGRGRAAEALELIARAAAAGDAEAFLVRGLWRIEGAVLPRDIIGARADLGRAAALGHPGAARVHAGFLAAGVGGPRDWPEAVAVLGRLAPSDPSAARQLALIERMALDAKGDPLALPAEEPISETPRIVSFPALFSPDECRLLAELGAARFAPALLFHEAKQQFVRHPIRQSDASSFPIASESPFVHALNRRIAAASGTDVAAGETLQLLRYGPGQQYRPHLDAIAGLANQRRLTMLVYLTDDYDGGETHFIAGGIKVKGRLGDGLLFANALANGAPDPASRHEGCPVTRGTKLIASRWIRERSPEDPNAGFGAHEAERAQ